MSFLRKNQTHSTGTWEKGNPQVKKKKSMVDVVVGRRPPQIKKCSEGIPTDKKKSGIRRKV